MKYIIITLWMVYYSTNSYSQNNMIFNPSFEQFDTCPNTLDQVHFASGWSSYKQSPDYYNSCSGISSIVSVPLNVAGFQYAHSGTGYIGLQTFFTPVTREIIGSELLSPTIIGQQYYISIYICCAFDTSQQGGQIACASNKIGVKFSTLSYSINNPAPINNFAHLFLDSVLIDTTNWFQLTGSFIADSVYNYIMVGNFFDDFNTDTIQFFPNYFRAYYLIDDICVSDYPECILTSQIGDLPFSNPVFYDQRSEKLIIDLSGESQSTFIIYNIYGKSIYEALYSERERNIEIDMSDFKNEIYIAYLTTKQNTFILKFIVN